jgi:hypothetical protein
MAESLLLLGLLLLLLLGLLLLIATPMTAAADRTLSPLITDLTRLRTPVLVCAVQATSM